jgi:hypothetical protein
MTPLTSKSLHFFAPSHMSFFFVSLTHSIFLKFFLFVFLSFDGSPLIHALIVQDQSLLTSATLIDILHFGSFLEVLHRRSLSNE